MNKFNLILLALAVAGISLSCAADSSDNSAVNNKEMLNEKQKVEKLKKVESKKTDLDKTMDELDKEFGS